MLLAFLIGYMCVNGLLIALAHQVNPNPPSTGQTVLISLLGLPIFVVAGLLLLKDGKKK